MKICIAQLKSLKGNVPKNIQNHLQMIKRAVRFQTDLIVFPELSITGYEPKLANKLAFDVNDKIFNPFQEESDKNDICIGIGIPSKSINGINISMLIFQPQIKRTVYSKRILHKDELPYFASGSKQPLLEIRGHTIALGICYETLQREHFIKAVASLAEIYIASVAKSDIGIEKANLHFPSISNEFGIPILMSNCIGFCDNFWTNGKSAVWNSNGKLLAQLDTKKQGLLIYDTELKEVKQINIRE